MSAPHMPYGIRPARGSDDTGLRELDDATWSTLHSVQSRPTQPSEPFFRDSDFGDPVCPVSCLVAEYSEGTEYAEGASGRLAGYVRLGVPTPLACNRHVRQIQGLAVAGWARGGGLGKALLRAAAQEARRQGAVRITLRVLGHNTPARRLYESEGYAVEGVLPGEFFIAGRYVDDVLMGRSLTP
ncbi:GNAT family N-acetyltransferase [Streptomyces sp. NPDC059828]|uniref:GNAT family N-acetyltransferase n=1 Tax=Streptomyces sp. NPDC059828 TaxID=3346965 RepID=UPI003653AB68